MIITDLQTRDLFEHERLFQSLTPEVVNSNLNAALLYDSNTKEASIVMKDSLANIQMTLDCSVEEDKDVGIFFEFSKLMYILQNYSEEDLKGLCIVADYDAVKETSKFNITCASDKLSLPHMVMTDAQRDDYLHLDFSLNDEEGFQWSTLTDSQKLDFSEGLANALNFLDTDEKKNNAVAVYPDKIIANDIKHVFLWKFNSQILLPLEKIPIHKKIARIASSLMHSGLLNAFVVNSSSALLSTSKATCRMNNAVSNIAPPSTDDLARISAESVGLEMDASTLYQTSKFFSGFYSTNTMNPLKVLFDPENLTFILQDSGLADFGSCNIERKVKASSSFEGEVTIVNNSLICFLGLLDMSNPVSLKIYVAQDKQAVRIVSDRMEIYLARLK